MTPSITGGTGHLQLTAGLRSERECWGNFLSRQAGLRMILSTVDTPSVTPPPGGSTGWWGEISLSFFFFSSLFFFLFIYLYRVSPRWGEALGRNKMSFFQEKIFLTKKNIFRPGANALNCWEKKTFRKNEISTRICTFGSFYGYVGHFVCVFRLYRWLGYVWCSD